MAVIDLLPYITSLGAFFVLIGFVMLIWTEGTSEHVSTLAFFCFVIGVIVIVASLYAQKNPPEPTATMQRTSQQQAAVDGCLSRVKATYLADLKDANITCASDTLGWPNPRCVAKSKIGNVLYTQLLADNELCYSTISR